MTRLNVWQRLGVVLSAIAILILPAVDWYLIAERMSDNSTTGYKDCLALMNSGSGVNSDFCNFWLLPAIPDFWPSYFDGMTVAIVLVLIAWALAYAATYIIRWILAGRKQNV